MARLTRQATLIHPYYFSFTKRLFDLTLSFLLLIGLSPFLLSIGILIMFTAGWPVFFHQKRVGRNKKTFLIHKFRVMYVGADKDQWRHQLQNEAPLPMFKNWQDPRFVGVGKWLSKTGLDELPQLYNILKGEMSFVGPRPLPVRETKKLTSGWNFRYQVKPGVFSEWSVALNRHTSLKNWRILELQTLQLGSPSYELYLIFRTLMLVFLSKL
jgi:lipopolysaccharide/colanic/teichoic acid biosynthesis glycosyltransferase